MPQDEDRPNRLAGPAGLVFAYVCFAASVGLIAAAIAILPLDRKVKLFLAAGAALLASMFVALAVATHLVARASRGPPGRRR